MYSFKIPPETVYEMIFFYKKWIRDWSYNWQFSMSPAPALAEALIGFLALMSESSQAPGDSDTLGLSTETHIIENIK